MEAKSDQLNFVDLGADGELLITVERVITTDAPQQPVSVYYTGCNNKPWKPSKGVIRVLAAAYGDDDQNIVGKSIMLYGEASVKWAGEATGGIRIKALSHINKSGIDVFVAENRNKRRKKHFDYLEAKPVKPEEPNETDLTWIRAAEVDFTVLDQLTDSNYRTRIEKFMGL